MAEATVSHLSWTEQTLAPGNFDKAWNDPSLFSYSVSSTPQAVGSRLLTKRVGFSSSLHDAGRLKSIIKIRFGFDRNYFSCQIHIT